MNSKGQQNIGTFILLFVGIIIAVTLIAGGISDNVTEVTTTRERFNETVTAAAAGQDLELTGSAFVGTPVVKNSTNLTSADVASNFTFSSKIVNGQKSAVMTTKAGAIYAGQPVNITYTYEPDGYAGDAGSRTVTSLITLFSALALAAFVVGYVFKDRLFG